MNDLLRFTLLGLGTGGIYALLGLGREPPGVYKGQHGPRVLVRAFQALHGLDA